MSEQQPKPSFYTRAMILIVTSRVGASFCRKVMHCIDVPLLRLTGGRFSFASSYPVLLLTTTGAKSGKERTIPLLYVQRGESVAVIGTRFGSTKHPGWYHNLRARPEATMAIKGKTTRCIARMAGDDERQEIWAQAAATYPGYDADKSRANRKIPIVAYKSRANRKIPIVVLTPK